jgi:peptidoglycan/LPS O-acetylase OafA/YrhL
LMNISFAFGVFCAINSEHISVSRQTLIGSYLLYFLFFGTDYSPLILIFSASITVLYISSNKWIMSLKPKYDISYGIYLWGFLIQQTLYHYTGHIYVGVHCLLSLVISGLFAFVTHIFIELPFIKLGKNLTLRIGKTSFFNDLN